jgi:hypothetical protein
MPLSDKWSLATHLTVVRKELADPVAKFWPDSELNHYIEDWQNDVQNQFEFVWGITTATQTTSGGNVLWNFSTWNGSTFNTVGSSTSLATITLANFVSDMLRPDAVYFVHADGTSVNRLAPRSKIDMDFIKRDWRETPAQATPVVVYQDDVDVLNLWPDPTIDGTFILEYPRILNFASSTDTQQIPAWARYSCKDYVAWRAYSRFGATQNVGKAIRYKQKYEMKLKRFRKYYDNYLPEMAMMARPGGKWAVDILRPRRTFIEQH